MCEGCKQVQQESGSFMTDAQGAFIQDGDRLERHISLHLNAKHKNYGKFIIALSKLLDNGKKENGLITFREGL
jgi:hypothetical protein